MIGVAEAADSGSSGSSASSSDLMVVAASVVLIDHRLIGGSEEGVASETDVFGSGLLSLDGVSSTSYSLSFGSLLAAIMSENRP
jgi:hypothetical protein